MEKANAFIFKTLDNNHYVESEKAREKYAIFETQYQDTLGFDAL